MLACSCSQNVCNCLHARILVNMCSIARNSVNPPLQLFFFYTYINGKSVMIGLFFNSSACNYCYVLAVSARLLAVTWRKTVILLIKERFWLAENLQSTRRARCSRCVFSKVLAARKKNLNTARACINKRTARMLANACKDHSIPLHSKLFHPEKGEGLRYLSQ